MGAVSGGCTGYTGGTEGQVAVATLLSAGIASAIGALFFLFTPDRREVCFFALIAVAACIAAEFGAWSLFIRPGIVAMVICVGGGFIAGRIAGDGYDADGFPALITVAVSVAAIAIASSAVVAGFWANVRSSSVDSIPPGFSFEIDHVPFAIIVGIAPAAVAAIAARLAGFVCRRRRSYPV